jgi:hypothetical protein
MVVSCPNCGATTPPWSRYSLIESPRLCHGLFKCPCGHVWWQVADLHACGLDPPGEPRPETWRDRPPLL